MTPQLHLRKVDSTPVIDQRTNKLIGIGNYLLNHFGCIDEFTALLEGSPVNAGILIAIPAGLRDKSYTLSYDYTTAYENASKLNGQLPQFLENHFKLMVTECILGIDNPEIDKSYEAISDYIEKSVTMGNWLAFWTVFKQCYSFFYSSIQIEQLSHILQANHQRQFIPRVSCACDLDYGITRVLEAHPSIKLTTSGRAVLRQNLLAIVQARTYGGEPNIEFYIASLVSTGLTRTEARKLLGI